ncbi:MAG: sulfotransferase [Ornithinimicrobium sp.]
MPRLPNFLYIGPDKAGSTWLHEVLIQHPDIYLSPAKDLYFFDRYYSKGREWYAGHFSDARDETVVGEVCQDYLADPDAPRRIHETLGAPKVMVTLRDPVQRAFSSYLYMRKHGEGPSTFAQALRAEPRLVEHGRYGAQIARFRQFVPARSLHIAVFDDLKSDPQSFVNAVLTWLDVAPMRLTEEQRGARLPASRARFLPLAWVVRRAANVARTLDQAELVGKVKRSAIVHRLLYTPWGATAPEIQDEDADWIKERLRDDVRALDDEYGLDLERRWGW